MNPLTPDWHAWLTQQRRALHRIPEIGFQEHKTQKHVLDVLASLKGWDVTTLCTTGVKAPSMQYINEY